MYIWKENKKRCNIYAAYCDEEGTFYIKVPDHLYEEIPEPVAPDDYSDKFYYRIEQDEAPYVVYTKKSDEQIAQIKQSELNDVSKKYLEGTDWMVTRFAETGTPIPEDVKQKRKEARDSIVEIVDASSMPVSE